MKKSLLALPMLMNAFCYAASPSPNSSPKSCVSPISYRSWASGHVSFDTRPQAEAAMNGFVEKLEGAGYLVVGQEVQIISRLSSGFQFGVAAVPKAVEACQDIQYDSAGWFNPFGASTQRAAQILYDSPDSARDAMQSMVSKLEANGWKVRTSRVVADTVFDAYHVIVHADR